MAPEPYRRRNVVFQFAVLDWKMLLLANVDEAKDACLGVRASTVSVRIRRGDRESHRVPLPLARSPGATADVPEIAERLESILRGRHFFMAGSSAVAAPPAAEGQSRWMRPIAVLQLAQWHEVWTGQEGILARRFSGTGYCNQRYESCQKKGSGAGTRGRWKHSGIESRIPDL